MFTGIIEEVGLINFLQPGKLTVAAAEVLKGIELGDSVNINGACLTVNNLSNNTFSVELMVETMRRTTFSTILTGQAVNLERALAADGRFGGHFVQGHVDGKGRILSMAPEGEAILMRIAAPSDIIRYLVEKGFIAVDGVSLTIIHCDQSSFTVSLVGYTIKNTTLGSRKPGDAVNLEVDIMAKYMERMNRGNKAGVSLEFLAENGFLAG